MAKRVGRQRNGAVEDWESPVVLPGQLGLFGWGESAEVPAKVDPVATIAARPRTKPWSSERKHLTAQEIDRLLAATKDNERTGLRDRCLILLMYRHGLRVTEACALQLDQVDLESKVLHVTRLKGGLSTSHPLRNEEIRLLRSWLNERARWLWRWQKHGLQTPPDRQAVFLSVRGQALSRKTFWQLLRAYGEAAGLSLPPHPHMLRHACGYAPADQGADTRLIQDYLGHRNIQHTVRYTATNVRRFDRLWR